MVYTEAQRRAKREWAARNRDILRKSAKKSREARKRYSFSLHKEEDKELINWLENQIAAKDMTVQDFLKDTFENLRKSEN
ncbi:MAG: hypothetical protein QNJ54_34445 [Prochloraceae cyanobacterium]|nr:hypothetical protein [Prochloraceae cyanobacterium]